jgi:glycerol-3-phosphate dehydrogenase
VSAPYDVVIIGGGIHGVGVAQAAAAAGHRCLVLEQIALAHGTSSRSSKLIHGGLRYLETGQWRLVRESLAERRLLLRLAPDLVRLVPFHIPIYPATARRPAQIRAGLMLYALLGGGGRDARFAHLPRAQWPTLDGLNTNGLQAVFRYYDAQTDDAALTRAAMRSALSLGAELACPARFVGAERHARGYAVRYVQAGQERECEAATIVNAAGPWVNVVLSRVMPVPPRLRLALVQGTHIVVEGRLTAGMYYVEATDRRAVFVMPWRDRTLVGTTETPYQGDPASVAPLAEEIEYLQRTLARYFPHHPTTVETAFAGLRVLPEDTASAFHRPRGTRLLGDTGAPRLVTIYGGKLTGYRRTADKVLRLLEGSLPARRPRADTRRLPLTPDDLVLPVAPVREAEAGESRGNG